MSTEAVEALRQFLPRVIQWIDSYVEEHTTRARTVASLDLRRLDEYFSDEVLSSAKVVVVDRVQAPPLRQLGLVGFDAFENMPAEAITYKDTFFVASRSERSESTHFHELVHVVQWQILGPESFLLLYGLGLVQCGYHGSPLEEMAYRLQALFDQGLPLADLEGSIRRETLALAQRSGIDVP